MIKAARTPKTVQVLATYRFHAIGRICFTVKSSKGSDRYNTCFQADGHESCTCPSHGGCYHRDQLREQAAVYFQSRKLTRLARAAYTALYDPCLVA